MWWRSRICLLVEARRIYTYTYIQYSTVKIKTCSTQRNFTANKMSIGKTRVLEAQLRYSSCAWVNVQNLNEKTETLTLRAYNYSLIFTVFRRRLDDSMPTKRIGLPITKWYTPERKKTFTKKWSSICIHCAYFFYYDVNFYSQLSTWASI